MSFLRPRILPCGRSGRFSNRRPSWPRCDSTDSRRRGEAEGKLSSGRKKERKRLKKAVRVVTDGKVPRAKSDEFVIRLFLKER